jgi:polyhydroxyalkanoate synthesis regulator phasin
MSDEELKERGWEPFQLKVLRQDMSIYLDSDEDLLKARQRVQYQREKIALLEEVIKELNNRHWKIRNAIEWRKFTNGQ